MEQLLEQIIPILIAAILGVFTVVIKSVGDVTIKYLNTKKDELISRIGIQEYNKRIATASDIWGIVDEHFRIYDSVAYEIDDKVKLFNKLLLERIPTLELSDLEYLRQTIAGKVNEGRDIFYPCEEMMEIE